MWDGIVAAVVAELKRFVEILLKTARRLGWLNLKEERVWKVSKVSGERHACRAGGDWPRSLRTHVFICIRRELLQIQWTVDGSGRVAACYGAATIRAPRSS